MAKKREEKNNPFVIAVVGPTAVGKSDFAVALARSLGKSGNGAEIISADSRQVYRGLDIGSGKVTKKEMRGVPHHLLDVADPRNVFSVADFTKLASAKIEDIIARGKVPIVCGGTGLYVDTLLSGSILPEVAPNPALRKKLESQSAEELFKILSKLDKDRADTIDAKNPVRLIRAIEIATALGKVPKVSGKPRWPTLYIGLDADDEQLESNIHERLSKRIKMGMLQEVEKVHLPISKGGYGLSWKRLEQLGLEYKYFAQLLQSKKQDEATMVAIFKNLELAIWQYAKRQRTWWKRNKDIIWIK
ncbi:MAG: tRNA (adenosine(37)-N6)-dimethylallyltransferase MiaA [Candidatus Pacebacteria bacterium]|nr:tRNA (adenosine(37)-N6)-dimethylallyltransferase MiaA [Candidatus Paceibacterota bacterium]